MGDQEVTVSEMSAELESLRAQLVEIREKQGRFETALSAGSIRIWISDLATGQIPFSETGSDLLGLETQTGAFTVDEWFSRIHPDDRQQVLSATEHRRKFALNPNAEPPWISNNHPSCLLSSHLAEPAATFP